MLPKKGRKEIIVDNVLYHYLIRGYVIVTIRNSNTGGYEADTEDEIKQFDVVVSFNLGGDPFFQMCLDNSDGDTCKLINSNEECEFVMKYI